MAYLRNRSSASLFAQVIALVGLSLLAAQIITVFILFNLPAPVPALYRLSEVVQTLKGERPNYGDRPPLVLHKAPGPPPWPIDSAVVPQMRATLAREFQASPDSVVIGARRSILADRRISRTLVDQVSHDDRTADHYLVEPFQVGVRQADGRWLIATPARNGWITPWHQRMILWYGLSTLIMAPVAYLFARQLAKPLNLFASAADRFGRDPRAPPISLSGSREIDVAVAAFNRMQERLRRYVDDRTGMVGAIAHDLRTPLTRLRFRIENAPEDLRKKMAADIDQMEAMVSATLTFVRDANRQATRTPLELSSLLESLCDEMAETGSRTEMAVGQKVILDGDPVALRRLFANLLENAVKFGGAARARISRDEHAAVVEIDDDGPGIPPEDAERVFEPFYRREPSRSRETGGIGLGLAVVRSIARGHGGDVSLLNRRGGGLTVRVVLPIG